jgi:hypothetical protein
MTMKLDQAHIARTLGTVRRGKVQAGGGYFGARQLAADIRARFRVPKGGGRRTDPAWNERRLVPLASRTLEQLEELSARLRKQGAPAIEPMQLAAILLERKTNEVSESEARTLVRKSGSGKRSKVGV